MHVHCVILTLFTYCTCFIYILISAVLHSPGFLLHLCLLFTTLWWFLVFFQVGVFSYPASCDSTSVLQQLCCSGAFLFNQGVGNQKGAGFYNVRGSMSGCGWGACTSMPAGRHHQDGVQSDSLDIPFWCCECNSMKLFLYHFFFPYIMTCFMFIFSFTGSVFQDSNERRRNHP